MIPDRMTGFVLFAAVVEADITTLERGAPREMQMLDPLIQQLFAQYKAEANRISRAELEAAPADLRGRLTAATGRFHDALALHTRVLTRIRNCSEGMIRAVAADVEKRRGRARPYAPPNAHQPATTPRPAASAMLYNAVV